jgi:hypothetical protein
LKKTTLFLLILIFISLGLGLSAQNYQLNNGLNGSVITTCSGNFYDSGGAAGNYNNNQNLTVTFCPSVSGQVITVSFSQLQVENTFDRLRVYDGPTPFHLPQAQDVSPSTSHQMVQLHRRDGRV